MKKEIKKQTWKYFWEQKFKELSAVFIVLFIIWSFVGIIFQIGWINDCWLENSNESSVKEICEGVSYEPAFPKWMMFSGIITTGIWIIIFLVFWIKDNWKKAKERAEEDFKNKRSRKHEKRNTTKRRTK